MHRRSFLQLSGLVMSDLYLKNVLASTDPFPALSFADDLCNQRATELARLVRNKDISVLELLEAHLRQIERVNPVLNAICTLVPEQAIEAARAMDSAIARGMEPGPLGGLPMAIKDLALTKGIRTTLGSPIYRDFVPDQDALFVQRLKKAGAVIIGKTNTPEFGAGSHTFNEVFGVTRNPYDIARTCGGSSGGAAVALASGMLPLADGSDMGGSLRNPAAWCNIVGFRPSPGRVPGWPSKISSPLPVTGPMARNVEDLVLLLSVMAGPDERVALSIDEPGSRFLEPLQKDFRGTRVAWTPDLGLYPVDPAVIDVCKKSLPVFRDLGCEVEDAHPDLTEAEDVFQVQRAYLFAKLGKDDYEKHRDKMKDTLVWNIEKGLKQSEDDFTRAEKMRVELVARTARFFEHYDYLVLPTVQVPPFPVETEWVKEINGVRLETYIDWMMICCAITVTGSPAISVPCGFTGDGLPIGLQIVGKSRGDFEVLQLAHAFEQATQYGNRRPPLCAQA